MIGIYKITSPNGKVYIGQSSNIEQRWAMYRRKACKSQPRLNNSFLKYGIDKHKFEVVLECEINELNEKERYYQELYNAIDRSAGLNCMLVKTNSENLVVSLETRNKIRESMKKSDKVKASLEKMRGRRKPHLSDEHKRKLSLALMGKNVGKKLSEEHKKKVSENSADAKLVLNLETGIFYPSAKEAYKTTNINYGPFTKKLSGFLRNKTSFKYV